MMILKLKFLLFFLDLIIVSHAEICLTGPTINRVFNIEVNNTGNSYKMTFLLNLNYEHTISVKNVVLNSDLTIGKLSQPIVEIIHHNIIIAPQSNHPINCPFTNVISEFQSGVFQSEILQFCFSADGLMWIGKFRTIPEQKLHLVNNTYYTMAGMPSSVDLNSLFESDFCRKKLNESKEVLNTLEAEYEFGLPFRALTRWGLNSFIAWYRKRKSIYLYPRPDEHPSEASIWVRPNMSSGWNSTNRPIKLYSDYCWIQAMSTGLLDEQNMNVRVVFGCSISSYNSFLVLEKDCPIETSILNPVQDFVPREVLQLNSNVKLFDLTHWTRCSRIVSFYLLNNMNLGFGVHRYSQSITSNPEQLDTLTNNPFNNPRFLHHLTVHAEGDDFWLLTGIMMVIKIRAKPICDRLYFERDYVELNARQLFNPFVKMVRTESRYYDGGQWRPPWDFVPETQNHTAPSVLQLPEHSYSYTWLYVFIGIGLSIFSFILLLFAVLRLAHRERGAVIFSKQSRVSLEHPDTKLMKSRQQHFLDQPPTQPPTLSQMPLFSEHDSAVIKTVDSRKLIPKSPKSKLKSLRSPGKKSKSRIQKSQIQNKT